MTAPKKNITKSKVSPAPATKPVVTPKAAPKKKSVVVAAAPVAAAAPAKAKVAVVAPAKPATASIVAVPAPVAVRPAAVKPVARPPVETVITAQIDVGFGNSLYIRGEGAGLSWDDGVPMECVGNELWRISLGDSKGGFTFKFLVNDLTWSAGENFKAESGANVTLVPEF